ncbi:hypothetical protein H2201_007822 [Coniosporium apollinis]|uniref:Major facilitator superfamily (MFS) profile domain-containing protein n=2 Tax=Coniosporium TaxID=2810619 RepID=A0ABQ9NLH6_9PEZI|nr:hypothetical protein H2199_003411 [Cladosporium sp. JES 115]KAJ9658382.1 hypothetical protein H2201_007822 [Coniosporium apollinis]
MDSPSSSTSSVVEDLFSSVSSQQPLMKHSMRNEEPRSPGTKIDDFDSYDNGNADTEATPRSKSLTDTLEVEGLSLYEKKCVLINREIDSMGMGNYQWYAWGLCGFGYMLDLLWAQAFGLVLSPLQQELGFGPGETGNISTAFSAGLTAGAFVWGILVDIIGRQWAFNLTVLISSIFGLCLGAANSYITFLVLTAFVGFGVGGNIPIDTTITLEFIPQDKRFLLALLSIFQPIGVIVCSAIAYGFIPNYICEPDFTSADRLPSCRVGSFYGITEPGQPCCRKQDNMGWRYLMYTLGGVTLLVFFLRFVVFTMYESPKFLVYRGKDAKAADVLQKISRVNKTVCSVTLESFEALEREHNSKHGLRSSGVAVLGSGTMQQKASLGEKLRLELSRYGMLFAGWQMTRLTILTWLTYICDFWGFTVAGFYLPQILQLKNAAISLSLRYTYRSYMYIYAPGIAGVLLGSLMYGVPRIGRKWTMVISSGLMGASIFVFSTVNNQASNVGLTIMEYFFQSMFNAVLYGWTPEAFPAPIRGTACGVASFWGRLFGIVSPLIAQHLYARTAEGGTGDINAVLYLAGGVTLGCVVTTALLPSKMVGSQSM